MKKYKHLIIGMILLSILFWNGSSEVNAAIYRIINPQGITVRVSTEPVLKEQEIEDGCKAYLLELGKKIDDFEQDDQIRGTVFLDINENGRRDPGEQGIANIQVTNGLDIVLTDQQGNFELDREGKFIYLTIPNDFSMTTSWYRIISDENMVFGLVEDQEKDRDNFTFIHFTDPHITLDEKYNEMMRVAMNEMNQIEPDFIVVTGDMVLEGDKVSIEQARRWFNRYVSLINCLEMPIYHTIGNHDVAGIFYHQDMSGQSGYNKGLYYSYFGPPYYSFDWGNFHCIVLDPNRFEEGRQYFEISEEQISWLRRDLSFYKEDTPLLVFFHEPIYSWTNKDELIHLWGNRQVRLFSGHWHFNVLLSHQGEDILEQVSGSLSGGWWKQEGPDGRLGGYRIYQIKGDEIDSFYREINQKRQIDWIEPKPMVSQLSDVMALIYTEHAPLIRAQYQINQGAWVPMVIEKQDAWFMAKGSIDCHDYLGPGYHEMTVQAEDEAGFFNKTINFKISPEEVLSFQELYANFSTYQGHLIQVEGKLIETITETLYSSQSHDFINGAMILKDHSDYGGILLGEYGIPKEEKLKKGELITAEIIPLRFRWELLSRKQKLMILFNLFRLPKGFLVLENCLKPESVQILWLIYLSTSEETTLL